MIKLPDSPAIGIPEIDEQHREFIALIKRLHTLSRTDVSRKELRTTLAELMAHAQKHFTDEEAHMRRTGYPLLAEHEAEHDAAAAKIHALLVHDADEPDLYRFLSNFLATWVTRHIMGRDGEFGKWLQTGLLPNQSGIEVTVQSYAMHSAVEEIDRLQ